MYEYLEGIISDALINYIVVDINGIGFKILVPNPYKYVVGDKNKVYIYNHIREDEHTLYGFSTYEERELFLKLISVKGMGPKMAMPILATGTISGILDAIERENILYLKKFPKIGEKLARQIILDLKGKLIKNSELIKEENDELSLALESLGYKGSDIKNVTNKIDKSLSIEMQIKEALKLLLNN